MDEQNKLEMWAVIELMGHGQTAGVIRTSDLGGLLRVDVPIEDGEGYRTEYYGDAAIYSVKIVSEEIARAYEQALQLARRQNETLNRQIRVLQDRLVAVN